MFNTKKFVDYGIFTCIPEGKSRVQNRSYSMYVPSFMNYVNRKDEGNISVY